VATQRQLVVATLLGRPLVLDSRRLVVGFVRALGMAALPLRTLVLLGRLRLGLGLGLLLGAGLGELVLVARLCGLVSLRLLLGMVLAALLPLLRLPDVAVRPGGSGAPSRRHSQATHIHRPDC
jgi:hypothetical protein